MPALSWRSYCLAYIDVVSSSIFSFSSHTSVLAQDSVATIPDVGNQTAAQHRGVGRIMLFLAMLLAVFMVTDQLISAGLRRVTTSYFGVYNRIVDGTINADIVISGSSRAMNNFDPRIIQQATGLTTF